MARLFIWLKLFINTFVPQNTLCAVNVFNTRIQYPFIYYKYLLHTYVFMYPYFHFDLNVRTEIWMITILLFVCRRTWNIYLLFHYQWFLLLFPIQISQYYFLNTCILYFRRRMFLNNFFHIYVLLQLIEKGRFQAPNESTNGCVRTNNTNNWMKNLKTKLRTEPEMSTI